MVDLCLAKGLSKEVMKDPSEHLDVGLVNHVLIKE